MRVNSTYKAFFSNRLKAGSGLATAMLAIFFIASSFTNRPDRDLWSKQVNLMIRQIGHRLLLQAGDSTSRVLPVTEIKEGTFELTFENEFDFNHDSLIALSQGLLPKTQFPSGYTVTVHEPMEANIVYGFQFSNTSPDNVACLGRSQPPGRYRIEITFPDLYGSVEQPKKKKVESKKTGINQPAEEPKPVKADPQPVNTIPKEVKTTNIKSKPPVTSRSNEDYPLVNLVFTGMLVLLGVTLLIGRLGKILKPLPVKNPDHSTLKEPVPQLATLGKFLFDVKDKRLQLDDEVIGLTDKECRILELLHENFGELILRETLMQKVWLDEGVITGRSLDMFVSKLRKKLSGDPELRITNVHGKGYKLEILVENGRDRG